MTNWIYWILVLAVSVSTGIKWLRVAQREHYIPWWVTRIAFGWAKSRPSSMWPLAAAIALWLIAISMRNDLLAVSALVVVTLWPWGLGFRGRSSKLQWTDRLRRLAIVWFVLAGVASLSFGLMGLAVLAPVFMDLALVIAKPIEKALSNKWLVAAQKKLRQVRPTVVAVTGSYGKTSTKGYIAHLVGTKFSVVPSPASFNNLLGLARAVNDKLTPGTEVFVAEMGVYGEGEIRELSKSFPPDIAAITVIGEAHLERMKNRATILRAKSEIVENAATVVLPIDDGDLSALADSCEAQGKRVIRVSAVGAKADVSVNPTKGVVTIGKDSAPVTISGVGHAVNVAVAVGIAHALGVPLAAMAPKLGSLPTAAHRAEPQQAPSGTIIIDDSYNANPTGAARAVTGGATMAAERKGKFIVVTPGMIELGPVQFERNCAFAEQIALVGGELFTVGFTNRKALLAGFPEATVFADRPAAMAAALERAGSTGVILVENDLPDHYA
jgi:UDP-N-acetylmuramoyl-tripeptide--D-alanyl-D-alanine ligase